MKTMINTIMQTCFIRHLGRAAQGRGHRGHQVTHQENLRQEGRRDRQDELQCVDQTLAHLHEVKGPQGRRKLEMRPAVFGDAPEFVRTVTARSSRARATTFRSAPSPWTAPSRPRPRSYEKRAIAMEIPNWDKDVCILCGKWRWSVRTRLCA